VVLASSQNIIADLAQALEATRKPEPVEVYSPTR
jgi:hypothetical protein